MSDSVARPRNSVSAKGEAVSTALPERPTTRLRKLLRQEPLVVAPGCYGPLVARLAEQIGFPAAYVGGMAISAGIYGRPDMGLSTMTEVLEVSRNVAATVSVPVIADIDQGFGDLLNVRRSIREFERAGLAGVHIEDESGPSKHAYGSTGQDVGLMCEKIRVAVDARSDPDFLIIVRCDTLRTEGFEKTVARCRSYVDAGAEALWVFTGHNGTIDELERIGESLGDVPNVYDMTLRGNESSLLPIERIQALGFKIAILPNLVLFGLIGETRRLLSELKRTGSIAHLVDQVAPAILVDEVIGLVEARQFQLRHARPNFIAPGSASSSTGLTTKQ